MRSLYDAGRCPYCARVRIVLAEKALGYDPVEVNLDERPAFIYELNPPAGRVPVLEEDGFVLPESAVIMSYLEERFPDPPLLPADPGERAVARLAVERFSSLLGGAYYDLYFQRPSGSVERVEEALAGLDARLEGMPFLGGREYSLADIAYVPWILRVEGRLGIPTAPYPRLAEWLGRLLERPAVAAERDVVAAL